MPKTDRDTEASSAELDIPRFARRCWDEWRSETEENRKAEEESLGFWVGGDLQWREGEIAKRRGSNRPYMTINRCKPAVDQVENEARNNPPGPEAYPVGDGADKDGADIYEGLIREYEYRSNAHTAYITGLRYAAAGGSGCFELATRYAGERSLQQELVVNEIPDPAAVFSDTNSRMACREDAMHGGKIRVLSREQLIESYPDVDLKVLSRSLIDRFQGWMQDATGWKGDQASVNTWTGGAQGKGPYYVCEFYRVVIKPAPLTLYTDKILRFKGEPVPEGVEPMVDEEGKEQGRMSPRRTVMKYVVTALDILEKTEWYGDQIPHFWILGPQIYIKGKLHRLSLITGTIGAQRGLNFSATSMLEITGGMTKSPWVGWLGQFDVQDAQGFNPWTSSNTQMYAYMEIKPTYSINPSTQVAELLPPPQKNTWEAPIAMLLNLATFFGEQIKAASGVFFDPSIQSVKDAQSGAAIKALQTQTNIGTLNWQDNLKHAVGMSYRQAAIILPQILDGPRVVTIVRPNSKHEIAEINQEFPADQALSETGVRKKRNNIVLGKFSLRAVAGPSFETRTDEALKRILEFLGIAPNVAGAPGLAPAILRMIGEGNQEIEALADMLSGGADGQDLTPEQMKAGLMKLTQENGMLKQGVQQLQKEIDAKLPQVQAQMFKTIFDNLTKIRVAEVTASKDGDNADANREAAALETKLGMAHDAATQATQQEHDKSQLAEQQAAAAAGQTRDHEQATVLADKAAEAAAGGE